MKMLITSNSQTSFEKENVGWLTLPDFKTYCEGTLIKTV